MVSSKPPVINSVVLVFSILVTVTNSQEFESSEIFGVSDRTIDLQELIQRNESEVISDGSFHSLRGRNDSVSSEKLSDDGVAIETKGDVNERNKRDVFVTSENFSDVKRTGDGEGVAMETKNSVNKRTRRNHPIGSNSVKSSSSMEVNNENRYNNNDNDIYERTGELTDCPFDDSFITCVKLTLIHKISEVLKVVEEYDKRRESYDMLNGLLSIEGVGEKSDKNDDVVDNFLTFKRSGNDTQKKLDLLLSSGIAKLFQNRSLNLNFVPGLKVRVFPSKNGNDLLNVTLKLDPHKEDNALEMVESRKKKEGFLKPWMLIPSAFMLGLFPYTLLQLKMLVTAAMMVNNFVLGGAILMTLRNLVFGTRPGGIITYANLGYKKERPLPHNPGYRNNQMHGGGPSHLAGFSHHGGGNLGSYSELTEVHTSHEGNLGSISHLKDTQGHSSQSGVSAVSHGISLLDSQGDSPDLSDSYSNQASNFYPGINTGILGVPEFVLPSYYSDMQAAQTMGYPAITNAYLDGHASHVVTKTLPPWVRNHRLRYRKTGTLSSTHKPETSTHPLKNS